MQYDFENAPDRSKTDSVKWDVKSGELPMWIAQRDTIVGTIVSIGITQG